MNYFEFGFGSSDDDIRTVADDIDETEQPIQEEAANEIEEYEQQPYAEQPVEDEAPAEAPQPADEELYPPVSPKKVGQANIVVLGVGGAGNNAVNNMVRAGIKSANFVVMNTDMQALNMAQVPPQCKIQLGERSTGGLGAGSDPEVGRAAAEESRDLIRSALKGIDLLFITAGMGGGTGTGAAPVIAEIAKELGILTVGVVTKPFSFEGARRMQNAENGIKNLRNFVDTLLVIPNNKLLEVLPKDVTFKRSFEIADDVLRQGVQGVSDVIANPELINLDFADVRTILSNKGLAHMGIGYGKGEKRVRDAVRGAVFSPLLETDIEGATAIIINIRGGDDMKLAEVYEACDLVKSIVDPSANIIFGMVTEPDKADLEITIIATGFVDKKQAPARPIGVPPRTTQHVASIFAPADEAAKPEAPAAEQSADDNLFAGRPTFGARPAQPASPAPDNADRQVPEPRRNPAASNEVRSSRMDVPTRGVPTFIRRMNGNQDNKQ